MKQDQIHHSGAFDPTPPFPSVFEFDILDNGHDIAKWVLETYAMAYSVGNDSAKERILSVAGPQTACLLRDAIVRHYQI